MREIHIGTKVFGKAHGKGPGRKFAEIALEVTPTQTSPLRRGTPTQELGKSNLPSTHAAQSKETRPSLRNTHSE